jgi:hypothetical protein
VGWSVVKEKPNVGTPIFGAFPSDRIPKVTKDVSVHLFILFFTFREEFIMDSALAIKNSSKLYQRIPETLLKLLGKHVLRDGILKIRFVSWDL